MKNLSLIAAIGENMELGYQNQLLCHLPKDLKHFKALTNGHPVVMGRKTWESLPIKPLPNRRNLILTTNKEIVFAGAETIFSIDELVHLIADEDEVFIIGGASVYHTFIHMANKLYITRIQASFPADVFFPKIDENRWMLVNEIPISYDEQNPYNLIFQTYISI